ncbi:MAG: AbrB/MazE/SpoVT family DNA-binding domain-containing protein [Nitrososphaerota archaeon]|nr:AbrB/MazE/SpoVT family DNA-binding domain-containing protein [Nitrososphaerota archaeon]
MKVTAKVRRIGNSLGVYIPAKEAAASRIGEGDTVEMEITGRSSAAELFGSAKFSRSAQELKDEARAGRGE